jgi:phage tail-like protein
MADPQPSSLLQYLPAIYREESFIGDFLLAFEKLLFGRDDGRLATAAAPSPALSAGEAEARELVRGHTIDRTYPGAPLALERTIASIATYFDPYKTPEDFLPWLASWTAFSLRADLAPEKQREFLANIISLYHRRGTKENLIDLLKIFTIGTPTVAEEFTGAQDKNPAAAATTEPLAFSPKYDNGASGVGATLTAAAPGVLIVDGYAVQRGERVLVKNQASAAENGIYTLTTAGTAAADYLLTRATDFDKPADVVHGAFAPVQHGTVNANKRFPIVAQGAIPIGTTGISFGAGFPLPSDAPHFFTVTLKLQRDLPEKQQHQIAIAHALVELEKPAHTDFKLEPDFEGMQIGVHSTVGADTQIGSIQYR